MSMPGPLEIVVILVVVLLLFGAKRLPEIGSSLGKGIRSFKSSVTGEEEGRQTSVNSDAPDPGDENK